MKNSPTLCQMFIANVLSPIRSKFPQSIILHYMDDILICSRDKRRVQIVLDSVMSALNSNGLVISPDKIQKESPWKYLGLKITNSAFAPQNITIRKTVKTLHDLQKLLGAINWIRPVLGISTDDLSPLFDLLKGDADLSSPWSLTLEAEQALQIVEQKISNHKAQRILEGVPVSLVLSLNDKQPLAVLGQFFHNDEDFCLWEWLFLPHQFSKTITTLPEMISKLCHKGRFRCLELSGKEPDFIFLPLTSEHFDQLLKGSIDFQIATVDYLGSIKFHIPACKFLQRLLPIPIDLKIMHSHIPIRDAKTVFTDGSGRTGNAVVVWQDHNNWKQDIHKAQGSPQLVELSAVVRAFFLFRSESLNIISDSSYVVGIIARIENSYLKHVANKSLFDLLTRLLFLIQHRQFPYFITHTRSHTTLPGPVAEGNQRADRLAGMTTIPNLLQQARMAHDFFHQNAKALQKQFGLTLAQAKEILKACPDCQAVAPLKAEGINPRGLSPLEIWQSDVTHINEFGKLKYVHVSIDTFSRYIVATAHSGEKSRDVRKHFLAAFARMGVPKQIKTDNGPSYVAKDTQVFFSSWGITHLTGIPYNPTGQGIVERAHQSIKNLLQKQNKGNIGMSPQEKLDKALYVLNFLNRLDDGNIPTSRTPTERHFQIQNEQVLHKAKIMYKDILTDKWLGPFPLITWGKGHACILTDSGTQWVPSRRVKIYRDPADSGTPMPPLQEQAPSSSL
ncbi:endogenous retrovirus group K member 18 Pol protein-like protein [Pitangus sulphuratus]|nr:endogenous retrovirus group K member 18 Pol protein-like protein [Pitangus sulphuratus]